MAHLNDYLSALQRLRSVGQTNERFYSRAAARSLLAELESCMKILDDCEPFVQSAHRASCDEVREETRLLEFELRETLQMPTPVHQEALVQRVRQWAAAVDRNQQDLFPGPLLEV
jgi:hypothetical protein